MIIDLEKMYEIALKSRQADYDAGERHYQNDGETDDHAGDEIAPAELAADDMRETIASMINRWLDNQKWEKIEATNKAHFD